MELPLKIVQAHEAVIHRLISCPVCKAQFHMSAPRYSLKQWCGAKAPKTVGEASDTWAGTPMPPSQCDKKLEHNPNADAQSDVACSGGCEYNCLAAGLAAD